jgi:uncharacterized membrane protein
MPRRFSFKHAVLLGAASVWLALILVAPLARASHSPTSPWIYAFFQPVCHQLPERSFHWLGSPLAVCNRCWGIYLGFGLGLLFWPWLTGPAEALLSRPRRLGWFLIPLGIDAVLPNTAWSRFGTGVVAGFPAALFVLIAVEQLPVSLRRFAGAPYGRAQRQPRQPGDALSVAAASTATQGGPPT